MENNSNINHRENEQLKSKLKSNDAIIKEDNEVIEIEDEDKPDDDVPGDFFDDFLKEDFMAGLDIVDEDDDPEEDKQKKQGIERNKKTTLKKDVDLSPIKKTNNKSKKSVDEDKRKGSSRTTSHRVFKDLNHDEKLKELDAELRRMRRGRLSSSSSSKQKKDIDIDEFDIRRDPEKTRRDIQKNKEKCKKDREKKILDEKLGLVETGLVPPGMEMEVDLEEIKRKERSERNASSHNGSDSHHSVGSRSKELKKSVGRDSRDSSKRKRSGTPSKQELGTSAVCKSHSPLREHKLTEKWELPKRRRQVESQNRERSGINRNSPKRRSPLHNRISPRRRSPRRRSPVVRRSPGYRRKSPFVRHRRDRSFSPSRRSRSPRRPLRRDEKKRSFLEELVEKLNEPRKDNLQARSYVPTAPVLAPQASALHTIVPQPFFPAATSNIYDPYDASFFIGNSAHPESPSQPVIHNISGEKQHMIQNIKLDNFLTSKEGISKLFQDKKIRLTDFLAVTKKPEEPVPSQANLKEKIKVLQRCQEALRVLESLETGSKGRLVVRNLETIDISADKTRSPLLRYPEVRLPFTTPGEKSKEFTFTKHCQQLLKVIGIDQQLCVTDEEISSICVPSKLHSLVTIVPAPIQLVLPIQKSTQTDPKLSECYECHHRQQIEYFSLGVQCGEPKLTYSVGTQVNEADFYAMIPKTQSLATLTPAQLLGKVTPEKISSGSLAKNLESFLAIRPLNAGGAPPPPVPPSLIDLPYVPGSMRMPYQGNSSVPHPPRYGNYGRF